MNLARKLEMARVAIESITRHDDATGEEIVECGRLLREHLAQELAESAKRREGAKAAQLAKLRGEG
jgi:hypothetical protein